MNPGAPNTTYRSDTIMNHTTATSALLVGNAVALGLRSGGCPVGLVKHIRKRSVTLALFDWFGGVFGAGYLDVPVADIAQVLTATYELDDQPGRRSCKVFHMDPLGTFQSSWQAPAEEVAA